jgi:hypothetical protein
MVALPSSWNPDNVSSRNESTVPLRANVVALAGALAIAGLAEVTLQRVVYRVGIHIPRSGPALDAYHAATSAGDFAFRLAAVLLGAVAVLAIAWLIQRREHPTAAVLAALAGLNLLAWPFGVSQAVVVAPFAFVAGTAWVAGRGLAGRSGSLVAMTLAAGVALAMTQYVSAFGAAGLSAPAAAELRLGSEASLVLAALFGAVAARPSASRVTVAGALAAAMLLGAAYAREPATVAILSLWTIGATMSLTPALYIAAFGAFVLATLTWAPNRGTRHLAIGLALLFVAGLQPQALHHGVTAFLGLVLLTLGQPQEEDTIGNLEVAHAS